jgi:hypothetical protein
MTPTNLENAIIEAALEELREVKQYAIKTAMAETPVDKGDLLQSIRVTDLPKKDLGFVVEWGEEQGPNVFVDYADEVVIGYKANNAGKGPIGSPNEYEKRSGKHIAQVFGSIYIE